MLDRQFIKEINTLRALNARYKKLRQAQHILYTLPSEVPADATIEGIDETLREIRDRMDSNPVYRAWLGDTARQAQDEYFADMPEVYRGGE